MAIRNSEPSAVEKAAYVIFPNVFSFFTETIIGLFLLGLSLFREWELPSTVSSESSAIATIQATYNTFSDTVSRTSYGRALVTIAFWSIIGAVCFVIVIKTINYFSAALRVIDEKKHDVFPRWYSGGSLFHDTVYDVVKWLLRHLLAVMLIVFALLFCLPISIAYVHIGVYGDEGYLYIVYGVLSMIFATRLFGMSLCIFSKKVTAWYAR